MPIFYSSYSSGQIRPVSPAFATVLSTEMGNPMQPGAEETTPHIRAAHGLREYSETLHERARRPALVAGQIMTTPAVSISTEVSLEDASRIMQQKGFRHLPVVSKEGKLSGIVSDRDVLRAGNKRSARVSQHMTVKVLTATSETSIREIAEALLQNRIGALPIVDDDHHVIGILSTTDILKAIIQHAPLELWA